MQDEMREGAEKKTSKRIKRVRVRRKGGDECKGSCEKIESKSIAFLASAEGKLNGAWSIVHLGAR